MHVHTCSSQQAAPHMMEAQQTINLVDSQTVMPYGRKDLRDHLGTRLLYLVDGYCFFYQK